MPKLVDRPIAQRITTHPRYHYKAELVVAVCVVSGILTAFVALAVYGMARVMGYWNY